MNIQEIRIRKLYGFLDKDIEFKNNISILVGINGSGKTSVLNIISWILGPNFSELCIIEFESIVLKFRYKGNDYILTSIQHDVEITIDLENVTRKKKYNRIQATFKIHPKKVTKNERLKEKLVDTYRVLTPEEHEEETWNFLFYEIPKPIVIGVDRHLYTKEGDDVRLEPDYRLIATKTVLEKNFNASSPLDKVKSLLEKEYNKYRNGILQLSSSLNEKIMLSAFDTIFTKTNIATLAKSPKPTVEAIDVLQEQVQNFLRDNQASKSARNRISIRISIKKVNKYFDELKNILKISGDNNEWNNLLYITNISQFQKINDLVDAFKAFEDQSKSLYKPLEEFLATVNNFFIDSAKTIYFEKESSEIKFLVLNKDDKKIADNRDIVNLSSGEKQILILLTYLKYNNNQNVFIIDEPELSLHPKWQAEFLAAVEKIMPNESQLIIATHSPEIIGSRRDFCKVLLPYNV